MAKAQSRSEGNMTEEEAVKRLQKRLEVDRNRQAHWRAANLERYRENQRNIMRKRREEPHPNRAI